MQSDASTFDSLEPETYRSSRHSVADPQTIESTNSERSLLPDAIVQNDAIADTVVQEQAIRLLEERLSVSYQKQKVGEVVIRKEIETQMIQVPVRREKLIVEQVGSSPRRLAEIDLSQGEIEGLEFVDAEVISSDGDRRSTVQGTLSSPRTAAWLLDAIAHQSNHGCGQIHIKIELKDATHRETYQNWFDRCRDNPDR
ncbi:DUF2382 domain-containing protein [Myxacorys almedinensis]|uniref:DUF2382 domain-containing protein n=1 Tax=Myxacorys almedinensis A TaxID=2690445 RepID=A0A8J7Z3Y6_9CYAN|nr:DUF2382 domain-containing protein [Myxacorys almedinensis]NDJ17426.1 DUF2382 domain-containing protein [Myxacorys almedinensis A]